jgi:hypothetical protein
MSWRNSASDGAIFETSFFSHYTNSIEACQARLESAD